MVNEILILSLSQNNINIYYAINIQNNKSLCKRMNYKNAVKSQDPTASVADEVLSIKRTQRFHKPGMLQMQLVNGRVEYSSEQFPRPLSHPLNRPSNQDVHQICLDNYVKLQERREAEYDATRWPGAFRELFPHYPPYPEDDELVGSDSEYSD